MKSGYSVEIDNFGSGCLRKCELLPAIYLLFLFTFVITFLFPFFQFLLFYRSDFIFLKILLLWSPPAQSKSPLSNQRFRLYIVFRRLQRFRECKFECKLPFLRLAETFLKSGFGWVIGQEEKLHTTSSLKMSTCRLAMKLTLDFKGIIQDPINSQNSPYVHLIYFSFPGNKLLTCISVYRTLGSVPLVSVVNEASDCTRFATTPITFTRLDFHQHFLDYKPGITRYLAAFLDECQIYLGGGERFGRRLPLPTLL